jgi:RimJ/RimL family protein N-acetyltransferase
LVDLVPMGETEFRTYLASSIPAYAQNNIDSGRWSPEEALQQAEKQYQELLPNGLASPNQYLFSIRDEEQGMNVGMLWFAVQERGGKASAFVYEIIIDEPFRRHGYAKQAFLLMEEKVRALGLDTISLHVFGYNHPARTMYEQLGYVPTNINMSKKLSDPQAE